MRSRIAAASVTAAFTSASVAASTPAGETMRSTSAPRRSAFAMSAVVTAVLPASADAVRPPPLREPLSPSRVRDSAPIP